VAFVDVIVFKVHSRRIQCVASRRNGSARYGTSVALD